MVRKQTGEFSVGSFNIKNTLFVKEDTFFGINERKTEEVCKDLELRYSPRLAI